MSGELAQSEHQGLAQLVCFEIIVGCIESHRDIDFEKCLLHRVRFFHPTYVHPGYEPLSSLVFFLKPRIVQQILPSF